VFDIDLELCPHCGGALAIIAAILNPTVIAKILAHLHPVQLPEPTPPFGPHSRATPKRPETWRLGPMMAQEISGILDSRPRSRVFDTPQAPRYFYCPQNRAFEILILCGSSAGGCSKR